MTKARDLANLIAAGNPLADGAIAVAEVTGAAPLASPTFTGTATAPTINASTALQIGGVAITSTAAELNKMDGVTVAASDINTVTAKAPSADPTFTGDVTLPDKIVHTGDTNTAIRFPANDTVAFETGGSERFRFASAGQLGIAGANYGTSGQVLQSGGASAAPTWADAGGGAYELILKQTISSAVSGLNFANPSAPQGQLLLIIDGVTTSHGYDQIELQYRDSSGNDLNGNSAYSVANYHWGVGGSTGVSQHTAHRIQINKGNNTTGSKPLFARINIYGWGTTTPHLAGQVVYTDNNGPYLRGGSLVAKYEDGSNVPNRLNISSANGNLTAGDIYLYKLA